MTQHTPDVEFGGEKEAIKAAWKKDPQWIKDLEEIWDWDARALYVVKSFISSLIQKEVNRVGRQCITEGIKQGMARQKEIGCNEWKCGKCELFPAGGELKHSKHCKLREEEIRQEAAAEERKRVIKEFQQYFEIKEDDLKTTLIKET
jgi:hypothetical protein